MLYIKWFILAFGNLFLKYLVAYPTTPIIVLFSNPYGELPDWLYIFSTPDNTLDGDKGWKKETRPFLKESNKVQRYINRCFWLWRNSLYGFNERYLSVKTEGNDYLADSGDTCITNGPNGKSGCSFRRLCRSTKVIAWEFYYVRRLKRFPTKCIRILLGYKLFQFRRYTSGKVSLALSAWINKFIV